MPFDINTLVVLLFGAGGAGAIAGIVNVYKTIRSGKIENEETLIRRLDASTKAAERRADEAEKEAEEYRKQRNAAREELARLRWHWMQKHGEAPPSFGNTDE